MLIAESSAGPLWYLLVGPLTAALTIYGMYLSQKKDREETKNRGRRLEEAMFGYTQGSTRVPGVYEIVVADGNGGNLSAIAKDARDTSKAIASKQEAIETEVYTIKDMATAAANLASDAKTALDERASTLASVERGQKRIEGQIKVLTKGQRAAAGEAAHVAEDLADAKTTKKAAARKRPAARLKATSKGN